MMPPPPAPSPVPLPLAGRLILITGGNGTIAAATAVAVARRGAAVVLGCRRPDAGAATVRAVSFGGGIGAGEGGSKE